MGWRTSRVIRLILSESMLLAAVGGLLGIAMGAAGIFALAHWHVTSGFVQGNIPFVAIGEGLLLAFAAAAVGASIPALRIARIPPIESLREA